MLCLLIRQGKLYGEKLLYYIVVVAVVVRLALEWREMSNHYILVAIMV